MNTIAYQGIHGAYSHLTGLELFGNHVSFIGVATFKAVYDAINSGEADGGILPIENSLCGSIYENYDLLSSNKAQIVGEHYTRIEHCLLIPQGENDVSLESIKRVYSHPKALEQCAQFLAEHPWIEPIATMNTAMAAKQVGSQPVGSPSAAIASSSAGELYGLRVLRKGIEDDPQNFTRFIIVAKRADSNGKANKCSLLLRLKHAPGALQDVLKAFADRGINLSKIESRPVHGHPFEYRFYLDFEFAGPTQNEIEEILDKLSKSVEKLILLGFYEKKVGLWKI